MPNEPADHGVPRRSQFHSPYAHGFVRVAVAVPRVQVADVVYNVDRTLSLAHRASERHAVVYRGRVLGVVPKTYLPNYREFYERRQFTPGGWVVNREIDFLGERVPFGNDLVFDAVNVAGFALFVEICEDLWVPIPPSTWGALAGATVLANLSASNITIGKADYRRSLCAGQSAKCIAAYVYAAAGAGESTTDLAWDGHAMIWENNVLLAESERFARDEQLIAADIDLDRLAQERSRMTSFNDLVGDEIERVRRIRRVPFELRLPDSEMELVREVERFPYVPRDAKDLDVRCNEAYSIQVHGLTKRLSSTGIEKVVIGVSSVHLRHKCSPTSAIRTRAASPSTTSRSRTCKRVSALHTCFVWPICITES